MTGKLDSIIFLCFYCVGKTFSAELNVEYDVGWMFVIEVSVTF